MQGTASEYLTCRFYSWDYRGRGWHLSPEPVDLEPPFIPFVRLLPQQRQIDDGKRHTFISKIIEKISGSDDKRPVEIDTLDYETIEPYADTNNFDHCALEIRLPRDRNVTPEFMKALLVMISSLNTTISFEIIGTASTITMQFVCPQIAAPHIKGMMNAYFPGFPVIQNNLGLDIFDEQLSLAVVDFGLRDELYRPLATSKSFSIDILLGLFAVLDQLKDRERAGIQILFSGTVNSWTESIVRSVTFRDGSSFFEDAPESPKLALEKTHSPLFAVTIRAFAQAIHEPAAMQLLSFVSHSLVLASKNNYNALLPLVDDQYDFETRADDILLRRSHRLGMLLNADELVNVLHFPSASIQSKKLYIGSRKTKALSQIAIGHPVKLGVNTHEGIETPVSLSSEQRLRHIHIIGATGTGKSTLLLHMIAQDIVQGNGCAVLDPHGDLIEHVLSIIPENRIKDVIVVDPSDSEFPVACNILFAHSAIEKEILASDLVAAFRRNSTSWGDQMNSVFANAIIAFLESTRGGTLADLRRFLIEKPYREEFLKSVTDLSIRYYWQKEYALLKTSSVGPILTRLDTFLRPRIIRNMVCQSKGLDFSHILDSRKILLIKLSRGLIGAENSYLLGTLFVSKIHQAALARQEKEIRPDFFLYVDEFHHFITPSMEEILSGTRKYHLGFVLAHQDTQQLQKQDSGLAGAVVGNVGTRICFRVGEIDAKKLAEGFSGFESSDLQNLGIGEAIGRIELPINDFSLSVPNSSALQQTGLKDSIITWSRSKFGTPRTIVEEALAKSLYKMDEQPSEPKQKYAPTPSTSIPKQEEYAKPETTPIVQETISRDVSLEQFGKRKRETQHRYLQTLIKKMGEDRGFKASVEAPTLDGSGKVDVLLEREDIAIACEVSITTDTRWELHNIKKCLASQYTTVVSCVPEVGEKEKLLAFFQKELGEAEFSKIKVFLPDELFAWLDKLTIQPTSTESTFKGYRVKVNYEQVSAD